MTGCGKEIRGAGALFSYYWVRGTGQRNHFTVAQGRSQHITTGEAQGSSCVGSLHFSDELKSLDCEPLRRRLLRIRHI